MCGDKACRAGLRILPDGALLPKAMPLEDKKLRALADELVAIDETADAVIGKARARADEVLAAARARTDRQSRGNR
jgi:hypothetical protein